MSSKFFPVRAQSPSHSIFKEMNDSLELVELFGTEALEEVMNLLLDRVQHVIILDIFFIFIFVFFEVVLLMLIFPNTVYSREQPESVQSCLEIERFLLGELARSTHPVFEPVVHLALKVAT